MSRKMYYKILDDGKNKISNTEWDEILRLQHWYNSEFIWTAGRLALKMFAVFPNTDHTQLNEDELWQRILSVRQKLMAEGLSENEIIHRLESEELVIVKNGGYFDDCIASGFTRVAGNEFNAYLVSEFLLKVSLVAQSAAIVVRDEGEFVKSGQIILKQGNVFVPPNEQLRKSFLEAMVFNRHVFAIVDAAKYDQFPKYNTTISNFNVLTKQEKNSILHDWSWLGYENNFDLNGDDIVGFDLNKKVISFKLDGNTL